MIELMALIFAVMSIIFNAIAFCILIADDVHDFFDNIAYKRELKKRGKKK